MNLIKILNVSSLKNTVKKRKRLVTERFSTSILGTQVVPKLHNEHLQLNDKDEPAGPVKSGGVGDRHCPEEDTQMANKHVRYSPSSVIREVSTSLPNYTHPVTGNAAPGIRPHETKTH